MKLRIEATAMAAKHRKVVIFEVSDSMAEELREIFRKRNSGELDAEVEGGKSVRINLSLLDSEGRF